MRTTNDNIKKIFEMKILVINLNYFDNKMDKKIEILNIAKNIEDNFDLKKYSVFLGINLVLVFM